MHRQTITPALAMPPVILAVARRTLGRGVLGAAMMVAASLASGGALTDARPRPAPVSFSERFVFDIPEPTGTAVELSDARREAAAALARLAAPSRPAGRYLTMLRPRGEAGSELVRYRVIDVADR